MKFIDRIDAGKRLSTALAAYSGEDTVIYALPRGGVVLAAEIAKKLDTTLDLVITRKIGHPLSPEYAIAAVTEAGDLEANQAEVVTVDRVWLKREIKKEITEAKRRRQTYLKGREVTDIKGRVAIIVDDGIATGLTMLAAIKDIRKRQPKKVVVAIPVTPRDIAVMLRMQADEVVSLEEPSFYLGAVGAYYDQFNQVQDEEVINIVNNFTSK